MRKKNSIKQTLNEIIKDLPVSKPSFKLFMTSFLYNMGFRVLLNYRIGKYLYHSNFFLLRQIGLFFRNRLITKRNCDISYNAIIGSNVRFPHPSGIIIGDGVIINNNVKIWQHVTLGSHGKKEETLKYPVVGNDVKIYAGAVLIGDINIGKGSIIGANSVVNIDVPNNSTVVGIPCRIL